MAGLIPASVTTDSPASRSGGRRQRRLGSWRARLLLHRNLVLGMWLSGGLLLTAVTSLMYTPQDPLSMSIGDRLQGPSAVHWLGLDQFGRDILSRVMLGSVVSMSVGGISVGIGLLLGVGCGMLSGYSGGALDEAVMRLLDALYGFPAILMALLITAACGPGMVTSMIAIGLVNIPIFARLTRANFLLLRERDFVSAACALGASDVTIIWRHIFPNILSPLLVQATISFPQAILAEAGLSYLGLGIQPPQPSWGSMLKEAQPFLGLAPSYAIFPGAAIAIAVLGCNLLGDGLRDLFDPKLTLPR